jgi:HAD superfamily hydrolase (TIGR01490 family)
MSTKKTIAVFDFDETLIKRDTLFDFLYFSFPKTKFLINCVRIIPTLVAFKLGRISNDQAKPRLLTLFLRNMTEAHFQKLCQNYVERLTYIQNDDAVARAKWHQNQGHKTIIISASVEDWIRPWARTHGIDEVIATKLERKQDILTGKLDGKNCHSKEKVTRLLTAYPNRQDYTIIAYGDGKSDKDIFELADEVFEKRFS